MEKIGLIAGNRKFPLLFAQSAKKKGYYIVAVAIRGDTDRSLNRLADKVHWVGLGELQKLIGIFKSEGITKVVMAGQVSPHRLFSKEVTQSKELQELLAAIKDKKADSIFGAVAARLNEAGLTLEDSRTFMEPFIPQKGTLTLRKPDFREWEDIYFGFDIAKAVAYLDIGQTVAVKDKTVIAIEAFEGTDRLIRRAGRVACGGIAVVKVSKPKQDMRFDIPVIGLNTIKNMVKAGARCLAVEAEKTLFLDQQPSIKLADRKGISIVAL